LLKGMFAIPADKVSANHCESNNETRSRHDIPQFDGFNKLCDSPNRIQSLKAEKVHLHGS